MDVFALVVAAVTDLLEGEWNADHSIGQEAQPANPAHTSRFDVSGNRQPGSRSNSSANSACWAFRMCAWSVGAEMSSDVATSSAVLERGQLK